jgi:hypothetical protein
MCVDKNKSVEMMTHNSVVIVSVVIVIVLEDGTPVRGLGECYREA